MLKKLIGLNLAIIMILSMLPISTMAAYDRPEKSEPEQMRELPERPSRLADAAHPESGKSERAGRLPERPEHSESGSNVRFKEESDAEAAPVLLAAADIPLNAENFPDANFRQFLSEYVDLSDDGVLSAQECSKVVEMVLNGEEIASLQGIEHFPQLEILECNSNALTR